MKYYYKKKENSYDIREFNYKIINFSDINLNIYFENCLIKIDNIEQITYLQHIKYFFNIKHFLIDYKLLDNEEVHFLYFVDKNCYIFDNNLDYYTYKQILANPIILGIVNVNLDLINKIILNDNEIINDICHININKIYNYYEIEKIIVLEKIKTILFDKIHNVFNKFLIYNISELPSCLTDENIVDIYTSLALKLGNIFMCHPVNDKTTDKGVSRSIKFDENASTLHFYSSNSRQPLHNDYAYYEKNNSPDMLAIFCLVPAEYGGVTSFITNNKLKNILKKYNPELLKKINTDITYIYTDIEKDDVKHSKKIFDSHTNESNWNYFQIKPQYNSSEIIKIKEEFFDFLNKKITDAKINTLSKKLQRGDCVIFNDHFVMHERSSFLGNRHLQDIAIGYKNKVLSSK